MSLFKEISAFIVRQTEGKIKMVFYPNGSPVFRDVRRYRVLKKVTQGKRLSLQIVVLKQRHEKFSCPALWIIFHLH